MARRQIQQGFNLDETAIPPCHRQATACIGSPNRLDIDLGVTNLNTRSALTLSFCDQQVFTVFGCTKQRVRTTHVQTPIRTHGPCNRVFDDKPFTVKIEPHDTS